MDTEHEDRFSAGVVPRGCGVAMTEYQELDTPGVHVHEPSRAGTVVLDSIRVAQREIYRRLESRLTGIHALSNCGPNDQTSLARRTACTVRADKEH